MSGLISLPQEILVHILARTPPPTIIRCRQVCRILRDLIDSSAELQYLVELYSFGYVPPNNPRLDLSYTEKVAFLREHQRKWKTTAAIKVETYPLQPLPGGRSSTYDFYGGIYARGSTVPTGGHTRRLDLYQLPSVNKGIEWKQWTHADLGVNVRDFAMEPDYDLLVLLEMHNPVLQPATAPPQGYQQQFRIHLRSLETNRPYPDAARPIIVDTLLTRRGDRRSFYFQIVGRYLAVMFVVDGGIRGDSWYLRVWDWTTGKAVTHIERSEHGAHSFTFISDRLILIPSPGPMGDNLMRSQGRLDIYTFMEPTGDASDQPAQHIASLGIPRIPFRSFADIIGLSCRCDPAPSPSTQSATRHPGRPSIFQLEPDNRVLCLTVKLLVLGRGRVMVQTQGMLHIPFVDLLSAVEVFLDEPDLGDTPVDIPWVVWANQTSWVGTNELYMGNECYVYGQRVVSIGTEHINVDSIDEGEAPVTRARSLIVLDFDPIRLRREWFHDDSEIDIIDPSVKTVLNSPVQQDLFWTMFMADVATADTPFTMRKTLINERLGQNYYVMIDDEHVVIVNQTSSGMESSLIVYSFN